MAYTIKGKEYPFLAKDELERPLPVLKKSYLYYKDIAGKTVDYILYNLFEGYKELKAETLGSTCFINDGKGGFTAQVLPDELQLAPLFSLQLYHLMALILQEVIFTESYLMKAGMMRSCPPFFLLINKTGIYKTPHSYLCRQERSGILNG